MENQNQPYQQIQPVAPAPLPQPSVQPQYQQLQPTAQPRKTGLRKLLWALLMLVIIAIAVYITYIASTAYVVTKLEKAYVMDGPSMAPTISKDERVLVANYNVLNTKLLNTSVTTNDVIVFTQSGLRQYGQPDTLQLIKRVVAVAGQRVLIANNKLTVYDVTHPNGFDPANAYVPNGVATAGSTDITVPTGKVFVLGDNRPDSLDSRAFGPVSESAIVGKVIGKLARP